MASALRYPVLPEPEELKGGGLMSGRMKALLITLAALGFAATNASAPWGP
jgi:hypothetical protein